MKLLIYVPHLNPRIKYIFSFIFNDILKTEIDFTVSKEDFTKSDLPKLSYAEQPVHGELFFKSTNLLFEHKIIPQQIKKTNFGEMKVPFPIESAESVKSVKSKNVENVKRFKHVKGAKSALPFDIFAASFYFLSRYEEYLHFENHKNEPYPVENSLQYKLNLLKFPVIDNWALILKNILLKHFPYLTFAGKHFSFQPVYIDIPSEKSKNSGFISDTITYIKAFIDKKLNAKGDKLAGIKQVIADMQHFGFIQNPNFMIPDQHHEQHFIAEIQIPKSYVKLTKQNAKNDYSMYYPNYPGFRPGTCTPFYWYDLQMEKQTHLLLHTVVTTDIALLNNKTTEALLLEINELISSVKLVNGDFYFLSSYNDIRPE